MDVKIANAIVKANKLGAGGIQVIGYIEPRSAADNDNIILITQIPIPSTACELAWYDK